MEKSQRVLSPSPLPLAPTSYNLPPGSRPHLDINLSQTIHFFFRTAGFPSKASFYDPDSQHILLQQLQKPNCIFSSTPAFYSSAHESLSDKILFSSFSTWPTFSEEEGDHKGLHWLVSQINQPPDISLSGTSSSFYFQTLINDRSSFCPIPIPHLKQFKREVINE